MRARLKHLLDDDLDRLSTDEPSEFVYLAQMLVGPSDGPGEESFDVVVCTPEWLAAQARQNGGLFNPRHHLVVNFETFDKRVVHDWLSKRVEEVSGETWQEIAERLARVGHWEFEDYQP